MRIAWKYLHGLQVISELEEPLGQVLGVTIDPELHQILQYEVGNKLFGLIPVGRRKLISFDQVVSMDSQKMVVMTTAQKEQVKQEKIPIAIDPGITTQALNEELAGDLE